MSAHILDKRNYDYIVSFISRHRDKSIYWPVVGEYKRISLSRSDQFFDIRKVEDLIQVLVDQNYRSVNYRYKDNEEYDQEEPETYIYDHLESIRRGDTSPVMACFAMLDSYEYQACETEDYYQTNACLLVNKIRSILIGTLLGGQDSYQAVY